MGPERQHKQEVIMSGHGAVFKWPWKYIDGGSRGHTHTHTHTHTHHTFRSLFPPCLELLVPPLYISLFFFISNLNSLFTLINSLI